MADNRGKIIYENNFRTGEMKTHGVNVHIYDKLSYYYLKTAKELFGHNTGMQTSWKLLWGKKWYLSKEGAA